MEELLTRFIVTLAMAEFWLDFDIHYFIPLVTMVVLIITAGLAYMQFRASVHWNRHHYAHEIIRTWNDNVTDNRGNILFWFGDAFIHHRCLTEEECRSRIFSGNTCLLDEITRVINYHEGFATAYRHNIAERAMIDRSVKDNISLWYKVFENFIRMESCRRGYEPWRAYTELMQIWIIEEKNVEARNPSRFGWWEKLRRRLDWVCAKREFNKKTDKESKTHVPKNCPRLERDQWCIKPCFMCRAASDPLFYSEHACSSK